MVHHLGFSNILFAGHFDDMANACNLDSPMFGMVSKALSFSLLPEVHPEVHPEIKTQLYQLNIHLRNWIGLIRLANGLWYF